MMTQQGCASCSFCLLRCAGMEWHVSWIFKPNLNNNDYHSSHQACDNVQNHMGASTIGPNAGLAMTQAWHESMRPKLVLQNRNLLELEKQTGELCDIHCCIWVNALCEEKFCPMWSKQLQHVSSLPCGASSYIVSELCCWDLIFELTSGPIPQWQLQEICRRWHQLSGILHDLLKA